MGTIYEVAINKLRRLQKSIADQLDLAHRKEDVLKILILEERYRQVSMRIEMLRSKMTNNRPKFHIK
jgi:hypothetical protein